LAIKVGMVSLGCPKNLVDSESMLGILQQTTDFIITPDAEDADVIIVNTCAFIDKAIGESIEAILDMAKYKERNCKLLIVTGCMAERYEDNILREIPEVDAVLGTNNFTRIAEVIQEALIGKKLILTRGFEEDLYNIADKTIKRKLATKGFAYLKIAEGCDNRCTYCVIPSLRGPYRSRKIENIIDEANQIAKEHDIKEIILVAQDTTNYGTDIYGKSMIVELIKKISEIDEIKWIRLLYCYPEKVTDELIKEIKSNPKLCKYLDIPIQHISDNILKAMGRRSSGEQIRTLLKTLKNEIPDVVIRTSIIVGFPGETDTDFEELCEFLKDEKLDRVGVFTYSRQESTPASRMKKQIAKKIKQERYDRIMMLQKSVSRGINESRMGRIYQVLVEGVAEDGIFYYGRSYAEAPEIDGVIYFASAEPLQTGQFVNVKILNIDDYDLIGEVINELA